MDFVLPVSQEEYESAGSKFISFPQPFVKGAVTYRKIECKNLDWDTPNKSMKVEIVVTEDGPDNNKEEKLSFGIDVKGVWKGKGI